MNTRELAAISIIWDWLPICGKPTQADFIFVLGNQSAKLPHSAAELYQSKYSQRIVVSGGFGRLTKFDSSSEAERYTQTLLALGIPATSIIVEDESSSTGENISKGQKLLENLGISVKTGLAVTTPLLSRRHLASLQKQWPEVRWTIITPAVVPISKRILLPDFSQFLNLCVGEVERIRVYPRQGFIDDYEIPTDVLKACKILIESGYTEQLPKN